MLYGPGSQEPGFVLQLLSVVVKYKIINNYSFNNHKYIQIYLYNCIQFNIISLVK